jgi:acyl-CoA synthetase (AMP-forming)/AMP-acid ligase II
VVAYLDELLTERASVEPGAALLEHAGRRWTYAQVNLLAERGAKWLVASGVRAGDRVLVLGDNSDGFVVAVLAALRAGAIFVPVSPGVARSMLPLIVATTSPAAVLADAPLMSACADHLGGIVGRDFAELLADRAGPGEVRVAGRGDVACIIFTSGSTGTAQGVACTHGAILAAIRAINTVLEQRADDRILCVLPFSFDYGLYQIFLAMDCGGTIVVASATTIVANVPRLVVNHSITVLPIVPALSVLLLRSRTLERVSRPRLRLVTNTGDLLPTSHQERWRDLLPNSLIVPMYGLTECKRVAILPPGRSREAPPGSVGLPLPGTQVSLHPLAGANGCVAEWGELMVQGPHLMAGYWNDQAATRARFPTHPTTGVRMLRSGDVFTRDSSGFLTFLGRAEALGHWRGHWMFPAPVEDKLAGLPGIDQAALVLARRGAETIGVTAHLCTLDGNAALEAAARAMIAEAFRDPPGIVIRFSPKLPYTPNGKIDRVALSQAGSP